eukprot:11187898-Lingulodinium_polyedra.AAC.1
MVYRSQLSQRTSEGRSGKARHIWQPTDANVYRCEVLVTVVLVTNTTPIATTTAIATYYYYY